MSLVNSSFVVNVTPGAMPPTVHVSEYDVGRTYTVTINGENGGAFNIPSGTTATVEGTLNGVTGFTTDATISGSTVSFALTESMTARNGKAWCKIKLTQNSQPIQTCAFILAVDRAGVEAETVIGADGFDTQIQNAVDNYLEDHPIAIDPTLSISGAAADAKVTGDNLDDLKSALSEVTTENICPNLYNPAEKIDGVILKGDGTTTSNEIYSTTGFMDVSEIVGETVYFSYGNPTTGVASASYGYVFYGEDKATVISSSIGTWQRTAVVPTGAYYLRVSVAKVVMESYYSVSTDSTLKYVAYYPPSIKLVCQDQVDTNTSDIEALKNPTFESYVTAYVKYPMKCGVRTDLYKQCILFGNKDKFAGFYSGNGVLHENSISYSPTDSSTLTEAYLTFYLDCTNADSAHTAVVGVKPIQSTLGSGATPKIMLIGDSLTAMGVYQKYVDDLLSDAGITPTWLGSLTSTYGLHHEGRSGWRAYTYTNCANGSDDIASLDGTNAFYFNNAFDFSSYMSAQGYSGVDIVFINLGTNDFTRGNHKDIAEVTGYWRTMIDSIHAYDSNIKVVLWLCPPPSDRNGINASIWNARYKDYQMIMNFRGNAWGHDNIFILPSHLGVDPIYDFPYAEVAPNATSTERIIESTDTTHLSTTGFEHLAYPICGMIQHICSL